MRFDDTIVALSSGALPSGIAVVRISGPHTEDVLRSVCGAVPEPRRLSLLPIGGETVLDRGLVAFFPGPASFTGEDCAELQVHGSPAGVRAVLRLLTAMEGIRLADAGEFTRRAFENGKLDLTAVEGLGDLIEAETEGQRALALDRLDGHLRDAVDRWRDMLLDLRAEIEAHLDFSDEGDVAEALSPRFFEQLKRLETELAKALESFQQGRIVRDGLRIALAGAPNAGKSSLLNALARSDIAIVTAEPGTTRDVREVAVDLGGQLVILVDLAGLRDTESLAETEGVRRARLEIARADLVLWLRAPDDSLTPPIDTAKPVWRIRTKADLCMRDLWGDLAISVQSTDGLHALRSKLSTFVADAVRHDEPTLLSRERDNAAISTAFDAVRDCNGSHLQPEVLAELLRQASQALERLVGRLDPERVLDRLFASFCIGK